jgi:hypothetical protein
MFTNIISTRCIEFCGSTSSSTASSASQLQGDEHIGYIPPLALKPRPELEAKMEKAACRAIQGVEEQLKKGHEAKKKNYEYGDEDSESAMDSSTHALNMFQACIREAATNTLLHKKPSYRLMQNHKFTWLHLCAVRELNRIRRTMGLSMHLNDRTRVQILTYITGRSSQF